MQEVSSEPTLALQEWNEEFMRIYAIVRWRSWARERSERAKPLVLLVR